MILLLSEAIHLIVSLALGLLLYYKYQKRSLIFIALFFGIFVDLDHIIDYVFFVGITNFSIIEFLQVRFFQQSGKIYIFFHGWEWSLILFVLAYFWKKYRPVILTISLAMLAHLLTDELSLAYYAHGHMIAGYSFIFRAAHGFAEHFFSYFIF